MNMNGKGVIIYIVGPTGVGKSEISCEVASRVNAEIISADSMQVYKGIHILTDKPREVCQQKVPHHLINVLPIEQAIDVAYFVKLAHEAIGEISQRGKNVLIVGGTGMYIRGLVDGVFNGPGRDDRIRKKLQHESAEYGSHALYNRLRQVDEAAAKKIHDKDTKRIVRALEVYEITGCPISTLQNQWNNSKDAIMIGLSRERKSLYGRIDNRVDRMVACGLVNEVKKIFSLDLQNNKGILQAIGCKEIIDYLENKISLDEAITTIKMHTRQYAKRQLTWFRKDERINWVELTESHSVKENSTRVLKIVKKILTVTG
ncbi:tRNA (adenosine(37)-N6)-dimethylallyltransferase MiaA [Chlamydiota bacterium]